MIRAGLKVAQRASVFRVAMPAAAMTTRPAGGSFLTAAPRVPAAAFASLAAPTPVVAVPARQMSLFGGFKEKVAAKVEEKKAEMGDQSFAKSIEQMITQGELTVDKYLAMMEQGLKDADGMKGKIAAFAGQAPDLAPIKNAVAVISALTPAERKSIRDSSNVPFLVKQRIQITAKIPVADINTVFRRYDEMKLVSGWVRRRKSRGLPLPESGQEMQEMMQQDPPQVPDHMRVKVRPKF